MKKMLLICVFGLGSITLLCTTIKLSDFEFTTWVNLKPLNLNKEANTIVFNYNNQQEDFIIGEKQNLLKDLKSDEKKHVFFASKYIFFPQAFGLPQDTLLYAETYTLSNLKEIYFFSPELRNLAIHIAKLKENNPSLAEEQKIDFQKLQESLLASSQARAELMAKTVNQN